MNIKHARKCLETIGYYGKFTKGQDGYAALVGLTDFVNDVEQILTPEFNVKTEKKPTAAHHSHAVVSTPMRGEGSKWGMATVTGGEHVGKDVYIMVEYADGWCICDLGDDDGMDTIHIDDLRMWIRVRAIVNRDGETFYDPL